MGPQAAQSMRCRHQEEEYRQQENQGFSDITVHHSFNYSGIFSFHYCRSFWKTHERAGLFYSVFGVLEWHCGHQVAEGSDFPPKDWSHSIHELDVGVKSCRGSGRHFLALSLNVFYIEHHHLFPPFSFYLPLAWSMLYDNKHWPWGGLQNLFCSHV